MAGETVSQTILVLLPTSLVRLAIQGLRSLLLRAPCVWFSLRLYVRPFRCMSLEMSGALLAAMFNIHRQELNIGLVLGLGRAFPFNLTVLEHCHVT